MTVSLIHNKFSYFFYIYISHIGLLFGLIFFYLFSTFNSIQTLCFPYPLFFRPSIFLCFFYGANILNYNRVSKLFKTALELNVCKGYKISKIPRSEDSLITYLSAPLHSSKIFPSSSFTITDIRFLVLLNSSTFRSV